MKKKFLYLVFLAFFSTFLATVTGFAFYFYSLGSEAIEEGTKKLNESYLSDLLLSYRNDLINGNIRYVRTQFHRLIEGGAITGYAISQNEAVLDAAGSKVSMDNNESRIVIPVYSEPEQKAIWGEVTFNLNSTAKSNFSSSFRDLIFWFSIILALLILTFGSFFTRAVESLNDGLIISIDNIFRGARRSPSMIAENVWEPTILFLKSIKKENELLDQENQEFQRHEVMYQVASQVAHDIRSPLSVLNSIASTLTRDDEVEKRELIENAIKRLRGISDDLLKFKNEKNKIALEPEEDRRKVLEGMEILTSLNIGSTIGLLMKEKAYEYQKDSRIKFLYRSEKPSVIVRFGIPKTALERIISNFVNNSVDAVVSDGAIAIELFFRGSSAQIVISDKGCGIPPEILNSLGKSELSFGKIGNAGTGIGYKGSRDLLESYGCTVAIKSQVNTGTQITVTIPESVTI